MTPLVETVGLRAGYGDVEIVRGLDLRVDAARWRGAVPRTEHP